MTASPFPHRTFTGWATDFSSVPLLEPWPSTSLDGRVQTDLHHAFGRAQEAGYNEVILWGLACGRSWSPHLPDTLTSQQAATVRTVISDARAHGLSLFLGVGVYSWGYDRIIAEHPGLDGGSEQAMCVSQPEAWEWVQRILDFMVDQFDPDGFSMQSADQGRCPCDRCAEMSVLEYHSRATAQTAAYLRSRWPSKIIQVSTWGLDLGNPAERDAIVAMARDVDVLNDQANSAARAGSDERRALIQALANTGCSYGTENGWYIDPPPFWCRDRWFLPIALRNVDYYRRLQADGGSAVERYILPLANPGAEVGFIFDGLLLSQSDRDPVSALAQALTAVFDPRPSALDALLAMWRTVESAYLDNTSTGRSERAIHLSSVHYSGLLPTERQLLRPEYLLRMTPAGLESYRRALHEAFEMTGKIQHELGRADRAHALRASVGTALADVERISAYRGGR